MFSKEFLLIILKARNTITDKLIVSLHNQCKHMILYIQAPYSTQKSFFSCKRTNYIPVMFTWGGGGVGGGGTKKKESQTINLSDLILLEKFSK